MLSGSLMQAQDEERRRVARELHDSAGQYLAAVQMNLAALANETTSMTEGLQARLADTISLVDHCTAECERSLICCIRRYWMMLDWLRLFRGTSKVFLNAAE